MQVVDEERAADNRVMRNEKQKIISERDMAQIQLKEVCEKL